MTPIMNIFFLLLILSAAVLCQIQANPLEFELIDETTDTPDSRFKHAIGAFYSLETLSDATNFVLTAFNQQYKGRRDYQEVLLTVRSFRPRGPDQPFSVSSTTANNIRVNADYIQEYIGDVKAEFTGIIYHETTRVWQWTGADTAPRGLLTGIADYMRLTAGWPSRGWSKRGSGFAWDEGYAITAYFLEYCNGLRDGFVADLNAMMMHYYTEAFFVQLLGKPVDELWDEYKSQYPAPALAAAPAY